MIRYYIPKTIAYDIQNIVEEDNFDNSCRKAMLEFDSSNMTKEKQIIHNIMKLKTTTCGELYSYDEEDKNKRLIEAFKNMTDNVLTIEEDLEETLLNVIAYGYSQKEMFFKVPADQTSEAMKINYRIKLESYAFVRKLKNEDNVTEIEKDFREYIVEFEPISTFVKELNNAKNIRLKTWRDAFEINTQVSSFDVSEQTITFNFSGGKYVFDKNKDVYPENRDYVLDGFITIVFEGDI